jgi:hypothetical protein
VVALFKHHRGAQVASTTLIAPMTRDFAAAVQSFAKGCGSFVTTPRDQESAG